MSLTWVSQTIPTGNSWGRLACDSANGIAICMGVSSSGQRSSNGGVTWAQVDASGGLPGITAGEAAFANGRFLVGSNFSGGSLLIYFSSDGGLNWTQASTSPAFTTTNRISLAFSPSLGTGNGMWCAISGNGTHVESSTSTDNGNTWSAITTINTTTTVPGFGRSFVWDGTNFAFAARDGSNNTCIFSSSDGSTWNKTILGSIFDPAGLCTNVYFGAGSYAIGFQSLPLVRTGTSISALTSGGTDFTSQMAGCTRIGAIFGSPLGQLVVAAGQTNSTGSANPDIGELAAAAWTFDSSPQGANNYLSDLCYDKKHSTFIGVGSGAQGNCITAAFSESATVTLNTPSITLTSSGSYQFFATTQVPPLAPVVWSVNGITNGNDVFGQVIDGFFTAPKIIAGKPPVVVTATRQDLPSISASAVVTFLGIGGVPPTSTPTNITAPAGIGGDKWGAHGGGIVPVGVNKPLMATLSNAERQANYRPIPVTVAPTPNSLAEQASDAALSTGTLDSALGHGGTTQG